VLTCFAVVLLRGYARGIKLDVLSVVCKRVVYITVSIRSNSRDLRSEWNVVLTSVWNLKSLSASMLWSGHTEQRSDLRSNTGWND
jgi:hypothetical protein